MRKQVIALELELPDDGYPITSLRLNLRVSKLIVSMLNEIIIPATGEETYAVPLVDAERRIYVVTVDAEGVEAAAQNFVKPVPDVIDTLEGKERTVYGLLVGMAFGFGTDIQTLD